MTERVLLVHPHIPARFNGAPLGLLYVAATTRAAGHLVRVVDLQAEPDPTRLTDEIRTWRPTVLGLSSTSPSFKAAVRLAGEAKRADPDLVVVKGGVHETHCAGHTIDHVPAIDFSLGGDADHTFPLLLDACEHPDRLAAVPGLAWRRDGRTVVNDAPQQPVVLDELPHPARDLLASPDRYDFSIFDGRRTTQVQTMRGCPFPCAFCNQRRRSPSIRATASVVEELFDLTRQGYRAVFFDDPTFTVNREQTAELTAAITAVGLGFAFGCQTRSELVDPQLLGGMADAGFDYVSFGLETTNEASLLAFAKTRSQTRHLQSACDAVGWCRDAGIRSCLNLIVGFPGETDESVFDTLTTAAALDPDFVSLSVLATYPHEDPATADRYLAGVSEAEVWQHFDEGYGAVHTHLSEDRARDVLRTAQRVLGAKLDVGLWT